MNSSPPPAVPTPPHPHQPRPILTTLLLVASGIRLLSGGAWLIALGGSFQCAIAGLALLFTAAVAWRRSGWAFGLYALLLAGTLAWSIVEVSFDLWQLELLLPLLLGLWLLTLPVRRHVAPVSHAMPMLLAFVVVVTLAAGLGTRSGDCAMAYALPDAALPTTAG